MSADRRLTNAFAPVAEAVLPDSVLAQERAIRGMVNDDATLRPDALVAALPWAVRDVFLPGAVTTGTDVIRLAMPQGAIIRHVGIAAGTAPGEGGFIIRFSPGSDTFSLPGGQSAVASGTTISVPPSAFLGISILRVSDAENVTISIHYQGGQT